MVWAWRPHRAKEVARRYDRLLVLLPFEPPYFEKEGLATRFIGHPVLESGAGSGDGAAFRARHGVASDAPLLTVLPGSRRGEVSRLLPIFTAAIGVLRARYPALRVAVPTLTHVAPLVRAAVWPIPPIVTVGDEEKYAAFAASDAAMAASGTVALELALAHLPSVIAYRVNPLTLAIGRRMVTVRFANLVNLLLDRLAVPELIQTHCTPAALAAAVADLFDRAEARAAQIAAYDEALARLGQGGESPSRRAARDILDMIEGGSDGHR
jgi:lipid-A-disaccharide synthase